MGNEGRVIIFVLISTGKSCGPAGSLEKKQLEGGSFCAHLKGDSGTWIPSPHTVEKGKAQV